MSNDDLRVRDFSSVVFFTGAGMSAESGVPTYRGAGGIWNEYNFEDYACQEAFDRDPEKVWDFHDKRRAMALSCVPHDGHRHIGDVLRDLPDALVVTQNIDGMHQRAGAPDDRVIELHGSMFRLRCDACGVIEHNVAHPLVPRTHRCGAHWRPDIVWFGDMLRMDAVQAAADAIARCDLLVSIGTSAVVYPAAQLPALAAQSGATLIEVNPEPTPMSELYPHRIREKASVALARLCA